MDKSDQSGPTGPHPPKAALRAELLTIPEVAALLRRGRSTVYKEIADGKLPIVKVRGGTFVRSDDLDVYFEGLRQIHGEKL